MNEEKNKMTAQDYTQKLELLPHPEGGYFKLDNFELADKERLMQTYPQHKALIERMCV